MSGERITVPVISADWPWRKCGEMPVHRELPVTIDELMSDPEAWDRFGRALRVFNRESLCQEQHAIGTDSRTAFDWR